MSKILSYEEKDTWVHRLSGVTKLVFFLLFTIVSMLTYDTRVLLAMIVLSLLFFKMSKTRWKQVGSVLKFVIFFLTINLIAIFVFAPYEGVGIYGSRTDLFHLFGNYTVTRERCLL